MLIGWLFAEIINKRYSFSNGLLKEKEKGFITYTFYDNYWILSLHLPGATRLRPVESFRLYVFLNLLKVIF